MNDQTLDAITIRGFRSIAEVLELELRPINVLIGANGSGKSNFLEVFSLLRKIRQGQLQQYVGGQGGADRILHFGSKTTRVLNLRLSFGGGTGHYDLELEPTADDRLHPTREAIQGPKPPLARGLAPGPGLEAGISVGRAEEGEEVTGLAQARLDTWTTFHFQDTGSTAPLRRTAELEDNRRLRPDGANLPAFLYLLRERHQKSYRLICRTLRQIAPFFGDFVLEPRALNQSFIRLEWRHHDSDQHFDVSALSDGTLRFIALSTLLLQPAELRPPIILIDEPELGLHPKAITMLGSLVRVASMKSQLILSTQSSRFLDEFEPGDVIVADRVDMATELRRLDEERLASWLEDYSLGELWEKNELGGR